MFLALDHHGQVQDLYFPYVGLENHLAGGCVHKIGVWVDGVFSWLDGPGWAFSIDYQHETLASNIRAVHQGLGLELKFIDVVYNESTIFLRTVTISNKSAARRSVKIFFHQQFHIKETIGGDTAYYDPSDAAIVHYKGRRFFLVSGMVGYDPFDDYSVGNFNLYGKEGTWKDAEDGMLAKNPIEHGSVDSVIAFTLDLEGQRAAVVRYWMTIAETLADAKRLQALVLEKSPEHMAQTTQDFWYAWVNKQNFAFYGLSNAMIDLFKKSLLVIRAHVDDNGAIIAAGDTSSSQYGLDTYAYVWPRDGAMAAQALDRAGYYDLSRMFYKFCIDVISDDGYFAHKFTVDKSLGSSWHPWIKDGKQRLPIQEDETAFILYAFWKHYEETKDLEFVEHAYNSFIKKAAHFLLSFRNPETGLPHPSYDIWEEKFGVSTFTCAAVYGALEAAENFARLLGKVQDESLFKTGARAVKRAILEHLYDERQGLFYKLIRIEDSGTFTFDETVDMSTFFGLFSFGVLPPGDLRLERFSQLVEEKLSRKMTVGGYGRYDRDRYFAHASVESDSNPWIITTMWMARYAIMRATTEKDLETARQYFAWAVNVASSSGILPEQIDATTGEHVSVAPLVWSHAAYVSAVVTYLEKLEELGIAKMCLPARTFAAI